MMSMAGSENNVENAIEDAYVNESSSKNSLMVSFNTLQVETANFLIAERINNKHSQPKIRCTNVYSLVW